jgi:hypothetical protein
VCFEGLVKGGVDTGLPNVVNQLVDFIKLA